MRRLLPVVGALCLAATCDRTRHTTVVETAQESWDASVTLETSQKVETDREEAQVSGAVDTVRVEEVFIPPPPDAGATPVLTRRVTTHTHVEPSTRTTAIKVVAQAQEGVSASLSGVSSKKTDSRVDEVQQSSWGPSFWGWAGLGLGGVAALVAVGWLVWRRLHFLG